MKVLYFARFRQIIGRGQDEITVPAGAASVNDLLKHLMQSDERVAEAFCDLRTLRVAVNQKHATLEASLAGATEVAFFPPVTGG